MPPRRLKSIPVRQGDSLRRACYVLTVIALLLFFLPIAPAHAQGIVSQCNESDLDEALRGGGMVQFACSGLIVTTSTKLIEYNTVLDATGQTVRIENQHNAAVFQVLPGVNLEMRNLHIEDFVDLPEFTLADYEPTPPNEWIYMLLGGITLVVVSLLTSLVAAPRIARRQTEGRSEN